MYTLDHLYPISEATIDEALSALTRVARHNTEAAQLLRAIKARSGCVGKVFNASRIPAIQAALPGYSVSYIIRDGLKRRPREVIICRLDDQGKAMYGPSNHWAFELATVDEPELSSARLDGLIAYHVEQAKTYTSIAAELPTQTAAYNAACAYLQPIKRSIETAMLYAGI